MKTTFRVYAVREIRIQTKIQPINNSNGGGVRERKATRAHLGIPTALRNSNVHCGGSGSFFTIFFFLFSERYEFVAYVKLKNGCEMNVKKKRKSRQYIYKIVNYVVVTSRESTLISIVYNSARFFFF